MNWHFHNFGKWEDVKVGDQSRSSISELAESGIILVRQVIEQQRRCSICNLVKTRYSA